MGHIFISYSRRNSATVDKAVSALENAGMNVWLDRDDMQTGNSWRKQIVEAIDTCDAFVLMLSPESAASENVLKEVILAADAHRTIMVMMLEHVKIPTEIRYPLAGLQFVDVPTLGFGKGVAQLTASLKEHLKKIKPTGENQNKQIELVIQGVDISKFGADKQEQLLTFIANLSGADRTQLNIANMTAGSVHVFIDMPAQAAYLLTALALNHDPRFAQLKIVSLRAVGGTLFIHIANGLLLPNATSAVRPWLGVTLTVVTAALVLTGGWFLFQRLASPPEQSQAPAKVEAATSTFTATPSETPSITPTATETSTPTETHTPTATATETPIPFRELTGVINSDRTPCQYGPGTLYLNNESFNNRLKVQVFGRDVNSGWAFVLGNGYAEKCWVSLDRIDLDGSVDELEPVYPGKVTLPYSNYWPAPQNVYTTRSKSDPDKLSIYWDAFILEPGDMESRNAPRYLLELWLCKDSTLNFTPVFAWENSIVVEDQAGCADPSSGVIYLSEKHGYPGPVTIPWMEHP